MELAGPGSAGGESQQYSAGAVDDDGGERDEAGASGPVRDGWRRCAGLWGEGGLRVPV